MGAAPKLSALARLAALAPRRARFALAPRLDALARLAARVGDNEFVPLPTVLGRFAWPDVGTPVAWTEETREPRGPRVRHGTARFMGRVTRVGVDRADPRSVDVWAAPEGGNERRVGIAGIRVPAKAIPGFKARAERLYAAQLEKSLKTQGEGRPYGEAIRAMNQSPADLGRTPSRSKGPARVLLSLFDHSGEWSRPFAEGGWEVIQVDLKHGDDVRDFSAKWLIEHVLQGYPTIDGIIAAPPCTDFARSGARWWKDKDASGETACSIELVRQTLRTVDFLKPAFWAIENPAGRIASLVPGVGGRKMVWDPCDFAGWTFPSDEDLMLLDAIRRKTPPMSAEDVALVKRLNVYTKRTVLYGDFNPPEKRRIEPVNTSMWGSWLQSLGGKTAKTKELRSVTPAGFARAFYEANKDRVALEQEEAA